MKIRLISFLACLIFLILSACKKDEMQEAFCEDIPPPETSQWGWAWTKVLPYYDLPCFNPNNPNEIIVRAHNSFADTVFQLIKYDLSLMEKEVIYEGDFAIRPRWSRKDWILLNQRDFNIYKIKSNGDSLTQLTTGGNCLGGEWNLAGDKFMYELFGGPNGTERVICDDLGNSLDTILGGTIVPSWQHDSLVVVANHAGVTIAQAHIDEYQFIEYDKGSIPGWTSAEWLDSENVIWANDEGIVTANIFDEMIIPIKESCDAKVYKYPTVSFETKQVIFQRTDKEITGTNVGTATSRLFIMNYDGSNEREILISD